jgi:hypothetical protein
LFLQISEFLLHLSLTYVNYILQFNFQDGRMKNKEVRSRYANYKNFTYLIMCFLFLQISEFLFHISLTYVNYILLFNFQDGRMKNKGVRSRYANYKNFSYFIFLFCFDGNLNFCFRYRLGILLLYCSLIFRTVAWKIRKLEADMQIIIISHI